MKLITTKEELDAVILSLRSGREDPGHCEKRSDEAIPLLCSKTLALVPTMGALHAGHLSLVDIAEQHADTTIVSIFVNPLQFGPNEDFSKYPRTLEKDLELLAGKKVDYVFAPSVEELYSTEAKKITADFEISNKLCGLARPGHFDGVCTVVNLFFELIEPDYAIFGEKDYQQLMVIQEMVSRLELPVKIIPAPIMREADGLAMSSRNRYLSEFDRKLAANIYKELSCLKENFSNENLKIAKDKLEKLGFKVEYLESHWDRIFVAAKLGTTRLIDNVVI